MWHCQLQFQCVVGGAVVERGVVGEVGGIVEECVSHLQCYCWMFHQLYQEGCWSVGVHLEHNAFARMGEVPSHQVGLGVEWWGEGGI